MGRFCQESRKIGISDNDILLVFCYIKAPGATVCYEYFFTLALHVLYVVSRYNKSFLSDSLVC